MGVMNPKVFVGVAIAALAVVLGGILLVGPTIDPQSPQMSGSPDIPAVMPLEIELEEITVSKISERSATIDVAFELRNPNDRSMIVTTMDYQLYETGYSQSEQLGGGQIGHRAEGMVEFGSNYYTLLGGNSIILRDEIILRNTGNTPELWSALGSDTNTWKVSGVVFYNLSSMTSGQENELFFEFVQ